MPVSLLALMAAAWTQPRGELRLTWSLRLSLSSPPGTRAALPAALGPHCGLLLGTDPRSCSLPSGHRPDLHPLLRASLCFCEETCSDRQQGPPSGGGGLAEGWVSVGRGREACYKVGRGRGGVLQSGPAGSRTWSLINISDSHMVP